MSFSYPDLDNSNVCPALNYLLIPKFPLLNNLFNIEFASKKMFDIAFFMITYSNAIPLAFTL